jgi:DNA-binding response OmpR family regulator
VTHDRTSALQQMEKNPCDLLILDLDLPDADATGKSGGAMLREFRAKRPNLSILALGGRAGALDLVNAFDNGADDYLPKPFSLLEMMARVRALRRRSEAAPASLLALEVKKSHIMLNPDQCSVERDGKVIGLTPREFTLLEYMMQHEGQTLSRARLTQDVWNMPAEGNTNIVDVYVKYLRDKLDGDYDIKMIRTIRGMGYVYQPQA